MKTAREALETVRFYLETTAQPGENIDKEYLYNTVRFVNMLIDFTEEDKSSKWKTMITALYNILRIYFTFKKKKL